MFSNYFFLKRLASSLNDRLTGYELVECFSQSKDELIIGLASDQGEFWIRANLDPNISLIAFPEHFARAKKNSVNLFQELVGKQIEKVRVFEWERSFELIFQDDYRLIFKMHGRRANVLLGKNNKVDYIFRKSLSADQEVSIDELNKEIVVSEEAFSSYDYEPSQFIPALGKEFQKRWEEISAPFDKAKKWVSFKALLEEIEAGPIYLDTETVSISLLKLDAQTTSDPIEAANWLYHKKTSYFYFEKEKNQIISGLNQKIKKSENYIFKTRESLRKVQNARNPEEIANILMANLHLITAGLTKVTLDDMYKGGLIEIKLNPKLSAQKNAETLYRKSKNRHQEIEMFEKNIREKELLIDSLKEKILNTESISDSKQLRKFKKEPSENQKEKTSLPYHEFEFEGWRILVGKHAKANDELTLKHATKNDLWLHAKDVSGSHVVIKEKPGHVVPNSVKEYAASIAASNSKRKRDSLCPVIITPRKFVRKKKGTPAGQVVVEKEDVILIEPLSDAR